MYNQPTCIICGSSKMKLHFYPPNRFNGKEFHYYKCLSCSSFSIFPIPNDQDFDLIYGTNDHSYLLNLNQDEQFIFNFNYPAYTYQRYQLDFLKEDLPILQGKKLLDFACGNGYYMAYAKTLGFEVTGVEYNADFAKLLRTKTLLDIQSLDEFEKIYEQVKFDVIHLGHVIEHLTEPKQIFEKLKKYSHPNTIFIIDGPLENNFCLSRFVINIGSIIKRKQYNTFAPQHLSFTTYDSQLDFFKAIGLNVIKYKAVEQFWPLPQKPQKDSLASWLIYLLVKSSIFLSGIFKKQGNIFHFAGKF